jgi:hypothetical protein
MGILEMRKALRNDSSGFVPLNPETMPDFAVRHVVEYRSRAQSGARPTGKYELRNTKKAAIAESGVTNDEREQMQRRAALAIL